MVCYEEVYSWFQNLQGSNRIKVMCRFLNMCYPLELRYYGTCLEDLARKDFYYYKDDEIKANDITEVLKIKNIHDMNTRCKLIVTLSLLNSTNTVCARELFKVLSEEIKIEVLGSLGVLSDFKLLEHYLLVLTLAQHHPAFTFEQQTFLTNLSLVLETFVTDFYPKGKCEGSYLPNSFVPERIPSHGNPDKVFSNTLHSYRHTPPRCSEYRQSHAQITSLKVKPSHKKTYLRIRVAWGNNKFTDAFKTPHDLLVFHQKLVQLFPTEAKNNNQDKCIPPLPHEIGTWNKQNIIPDCVANAVAEYIQQLNSRLPSYIFESEFFRNFFLPSYSNRATLTRNTRIADSGSMDVPQRNSRLRSLTIYNSRMSDNSPRRHPEQRQKIVPVTQRKLCENGSNICSKPSPVNSPIESPLSSPYVSPLNSETNSRAPSPWNIPPPSVGCSVSNSCKIGPESPGMEKIQSKENPDQWDSFQNDKLEELPAIPVQELEALSIIEGTRAKIAKDLDCKSPPNGIIGCYIPKSALYVNTGPLLQLNSNDSSPVCSEYSSPPQSPSPGETCNQSSSLSSGNEENNGSLSKAVSEMCKVDEAAASVPDSPFKRTDEDSVCIKGIPNRSVAVIPFAVPYSSIVTPIPPPQNIKPAYLPITCRTNNGTHHIGPGAVVFDNQFSRVPLPSALTFLPGPQRSHAATPDRVLSPSSLPISTVCPFPVVTSGCTTVPSATCSITTHRSSNVTVVTHSGASSNRYTPKNSNVARDSDIKPLQQGTDTPYATGYILNSPNPLTTVSCSCFTTNSARPSPAPSPSVMSPGATPQPSAVPVSMSYHLGMPYLIHSIPFLQAQTPANGFVPQAGMTNSGQSFSYTLPNGMTAVSPELIYPGQTFTIQSPSTQSNPCPVAATPVTHCYGAFPQSAALPVKLGTCYNCGKVGHRGQECKEQTMDDMNKSGKFQLNYNPIPKISDYHE